MSYRSKAMLSFVLVWGLSACKTFNFEAEAVAQEKIASIFVIIAKPELLQAVDPCDLVGPDTEGHYSYFVQILPLASGGGWELASSDGGLPLTPELGKNTISLDISGEIIETLKGAEIALVVRFSGGKCLQKKTLLVSKGEVQYVIGDTSILERD